MTLKTRVQKLERAWGKGKPSVVVTMNIGGFSDEDIVGARIDDQIYSRRPGETLLCLQARLQTNCRQRLLFIRWLGKNRPQEAST